MQTNSDSSSAWKELVGNTNNVQNLAAVSLDTFLNTGHFALEKCGDAIADHIRRFMTTHVA